MTTLWHRLETELKDLIRDGRIAILCNQVSFDLATGKYLFQELRERTRLKRVFLPEHGLFAELQDQVPLISTDVYDYLGLGDVEFVSLYGESPASLIAAREQMEDLDLLLVDVQDVGSRYYTFATTVSYLLDALADSRLPLTVAVIDRPNPAGRKVEGTMLPEEYESFVGRRGLPHRHGLTIGELCLFYRDQIDSDIDLRIIPMNEGIRCDLMSFPAARSTWEIAPSPNMPGPITPLVYPGQCLIEGTNLSEGRGTTRPFEIFGAPFIRAGSLPGDPNAVLRPLRFIPTFHKFQGEVCNGVQIHVKNRFYNSLAHSLKMIRYIRENHPDDFRWRDGTYEFGNDITAIEMLTGDPVLLDYLEGRADCRVLRDALRQGEEDWMRIAEKFLLYPAPLFREENDPDYDYP